MAALSAPAGGAGLSAAARPPGSGAAPSGAGAGGAWVLLSLGLAALAGVARGVVVARVLGPAELGVAAVALLVLATVEALTATGIETALVNHPGRAERDLDPAFTLQALRGIAVAAVMWMAAPWAAAFFDVPRAAAMVQALALVPLLHGVQNPAVALAVRRMEFRRLFWWRLPETVAGLAVAVAVVLARRDAWALVAAVVGAQGVATAVSYGMVPRLPRVVLRGRGVRRLLFYARWINGARLLAFLSLQLDNLLVGKLLGTRALGLYQLAFRLSELPVTTVTRAVGQVALPALTALRRDPAGLRRRYRRALVVAAGAGAAFVAGVLLAAPRVVPWVLGAQWRPIVPLLGILSLAMVFRSVVIVAGELFYAVGRPRLVLYVNAVRLAAMALAVYPLLRARGTTGVALAFLGSSAVAAAVAAWLADRATRAPFGRVTSTPAPVDAPSPSVAAELDMGQPRQGV